MKLCSNFKTSLKKMMWNWKIYYQIQVQWLKTYLTHLLKYRKLVSFLFWFNTLANCIKFRSRELFCCFSVSTFQFMRRQKLKSTTKEIVVKLLLSSSKLPIIVIRLSLNILNLLPNNISDFLFFQCQIFIDLLIIWVK